MRAWRVIASVALVVTVLVAAGWSVRTQGVRHASVRLGNVGPGGIPLVVDVWSDTSTGELAFQVRGGTDVSLLRGRTIFGVTDGRLGDETVYQSVRDAWRIVHERYGLTAAQATAALAAGETIARPALMTVPKRDPYEYTFTRDFGTNMGALRRAARFALPSPGPRLDGRMLADVSLTRTRTVNGDLGNLGVIIYSSNPARLGAGDTEDLLNVASPTSGAGASYATFFSNTGRRIAGPGYDARIMNDGDAILRYHGSYVLVRLDEQASGSRWRSVLGRIARS